MDDFDLYDSLTSTKTAALMDSVRGTMKAATEWTKANKGMASAIGAGVGGLGVAGLSLASHKKGKDGLSAEQKAARGAEKATAKDKDKSYAKGAAHAVAKGTSAYADTATKHPLAAAIAEGVAIGVPAGMAIAGMLTKNKKASVEQSLHDFGDSFGRELAQKMAGVEEIGKTVGELGKHVLKTPTLKRMAVGAGVGMAGHAALRDPNQKSDYLGAAAKGAIAGQFAPKAVTEASKMKNTFGTAMKAGLGSK